MTPVYSVERTGREEGGREQEKEKEKDEDNENQGNRGRTRVRTKKDPHSQKSGVKGHRSYKEVPWFVHSTRGNDHLNRTRLCPLFFPSSPVDPGADHYSTRQGEDSSSKTTLVIDSLIPKGELNVRATNNTYRVS